MGIFLSCCRGGEEDLITPDPETKRRNLAEAAEKRMKENEARGIKNVESVKRMQEKDKERERLEKNEMAKGNYGTSGGLKWQVS